VADGTGARALEVRGLTAGYGHLAVVHDVGFSVGRGEIVGLLGRNGAGKTTTIMAVGGFLGRYAGEVKVAGVVLDGPPYRRTRTHLGIVVDRAFVMNKGVIRAELPGSDLTAREAEIERIYLGGIDE
jgi:branched-chain amino acid transport system ATP-binding protein